MFDLDIEKLVVSRLASVVPKERIARSNMGFVAPRDGLWVRVTIQSSLSQITSITDNPCIADYGIISIQIFSIENTGTGAAKQLAKQIAYAIDLDPIPNVIIDPPTLADIGMAGGNTFYQHNLNFSYQYHGVYK